MYLKGVSRCQVLDRSGTLSCLDKRWIWQILWPWETSEFGAIHSLSLCETGTKSPILLLEKWWHGGSPSLIRPHHFYSLPSKTLFTGIGVRVIWSRFPSLLSRKDFRESTACLKSHHTIKLWDQTVPNFATLWWLWLFLAKFRKVGQTFSICSPLIQ